MAQCTQDGRFTTAVIKPRICLCSRSSGSSRQRPAMENCCHLSIHLCCGCVNLFPVPRIPGMSGGYLRRVGKTLSVYGGLWISLMAFLWQFNLSPLWAILQWQLNYYFFILSKKDKHLMTSLIYIYYQHIKSFTVCCSLAHKYFTGLFSKSLL